MTTFQNALHFRDAILEQFYINTFRVQNENFDAERFNFDGVDRSKSVDIAGLRKFFILFLDKYREFYRAFLLMGNESSRNWFVQLILYKMMGHLRVKLPSNNTDHWAARKQAENLSKKVSELPLKSWIGSLFHFDFMFEDQLFKFDGSSSNIAWTFLLNQYYYEETEIIIRPEYGDFLVDLGACYGDTALRFAHSAGEKGKVYTFDFMPDHLNVMRYNFSQNPSFTNRITVFPYAVGEFSNQIEAGAFQNLGLDPGASLYKITGEIPIRSIDDLVASGEIERVNFIKADIEGYELQALKGAERTIRTYKPKLAISAYHKPDDFCELIGWIDGLDLGYQFFMSHYTIHQEETVLYAKTDF